MYCIAERGTGAGVGEQVVDDHLEAVDPVAYAAEIARDFPGLGAAEILPYPFHQVGYAAKRGLQVVGNRVGEFLQIGVGLPQFELHGLAPGDVGNGGEHHPVFVAGYRTQLYLHRKLRAILAARRQIAAGSHLTHRGRGGEMSPVRRVTAAKTLRQQYVQRMAEKFRARVTEHRFGPRIGEDNGASQIGHDHPARSRLDDSLHELFSALARHPRILRCAAIRRHHGAYGVR